MKNLILILLITTLAGCGGSSSSEKDPSQDPSHCSDNNTFYRHSGTRDVSQTAQVFEINNCNNVRFVINHSSVTNQEVYYELDDGMYRTTDYYHHRDVYFRSHDDKIRKHYDEVTTDFDFMYVKVYGYDEVSEEYLIVDEYPLLPNDEEFEKVMPLIINDYKDAELAKQNATEVHSPEVLPDLSLVDYYYPPLF